MPSHVQSHKLVHMSVIHCHVRASSTSGCAFVYFTVQYYIEYSSTVSLFQAQDVRKQASKQQYIADCAGWVPRLTLLDLRTNWIYECSQNTPGLYVRNLLYSFGIYFCLLNTILLRLILLFV